MSIYDKEESKNGESRLILTEVPQLDGLTGLTVICQEHGEEMEEVDKSERGLPNYYCRRGCKAEVGIGRVAKIFDDKGYGFISTEGENVFFHFSKLNGVWPVEKGELLKFHMGFNPVSGEIQAVRIESLEGLRRRRQMEIPLRTKGRDETLRRNVPASGINKLDQDKGSNPKE